MNGSPLRRREPIYAAARMIFRRLNGRKPAAFTDSLRDPISILLQHQDLLRRDWHRMRLAEQRGWHLATARLQGELLGDVERVRQDLTALGHAVKHQSECSSQPPCSLHLLVDELRQLCQDFDHVAFRLRERKIVAHTSPIVLEDLNLGCFAIELNLERLGQCTDNSCFQCVALEPNPASSSDSVTHPHVKDQSLCAGDATVPIAAALRQGRVCDAFCLVASVLRNYNAASPYVSIDQWNGVRCSDCDALVSGDDLHYCENCSHDVCDDCYSSCDCCSDGCCRGCLDRVSGRDCCPGCRKTCTDCGRIVDVDDFDDESELCPACLEQQSEQTPSSTQPEQENAHGELVELLETGTRDGAAG